MKTLHRCRRILCIFLLSTASGYAQKVEVFGSVGYGRTFRIEDVSPGSGVFWGFGAGFRPSPRIRLEGAIENLDVLSQPRDHVQNILHPRGSLVYEFSPTQVRPFLIAGAGAARIRDLQTITFPTGTQIREQTETTFALHFGGGLSIQPQNRVAIRPQFVVITPLASRSNVNLLHFSTQIAFSW